MQTAIVLAYSSSKIAAFGMMMPERAYNAEKYRWGYNGKENDNETRWQDYGFRMFYPGLGKFLSVDPLTKSYPWYTPYQFAGNTPIQALDLDGLEILDFRTSIYYMTTGVGSVSNETYIYVRNIPEAIASTANGKGEIYFKYKVGGKPTTDGKAPIGLSYVQTVDEGRYAPEFWGLANSAEMTDADAPSGLRGNDFSRHGATDPNSNVATKFTDVSAFLQHLSGLFSNWKNTSVWEGLTKEKGDRNAFYKATSLTDNSFADGSIKPISQLFNATGRAAITNYILDGTDLFNPEYYSGDSKNTVMKFNLQAMDAAKSIMQKNGIEISKDFTDKYKSYQKAVEIKKTQD